LGRVDPACATPAIHLPSDDIIMPSSDSWPMSAVPTILPGGVLVRSMTVSTPLPLGSPRLPTTADLPSGVTAAA
jgi:hypothetical protein